MSGFLVNLHPSFGRLLSQVSFSKTLRHEFVFDRRNDGMLIMSGAFPRRARALGDDCALDSKLPGARRRR